MESNDHSLNNIITKVDSLSREIDTLRGVVDRPAPWYKNIPTIVSALALLFSFGTTYVSYNRTTAQDIHALRLELRAILQRLASLPKDNFEAHQKYSGNHAAIQFISGFVNQENALLARQAAEIIQRLPKSQVSATEYYSIALALQFSYNLDGALALFQNAIEASRDFNDEVAALRSHANVLFQLGKVGDGRVSYQKALNIFEKYRTYNEFTKVNTNVLTELFWAAAEANSGFMNLANQHISSAETYVSGLQPSPGTEQLKGQIAQVKSELQAGLAITNPTIGIPNPPPMVPEKKN